MNKVMKSFALFLSMSLTSNSWVCANPTIGTLLNQAKEKVELNLISKLPGEFNSQIARLFVITLNNFAKNFNYVGIVDPKDVIISKDEPENTTGVRLPGTWPKDAFVFDHGQSLNSLYYHDRNVLDHTPGFFNFLLFQGHSQLKDEDKGVFDKLNNIVGVKRLEALLNCILSLDTPRLNNLVLGACLYVAALKSGADAFMVHTNLNGDPWKFNAKNSETSVVISTKDETFMFTFKSNKKSSFYLLKQNLLNLPFTVSTLPPEFKEGSILYFTGKVSDLGLEPNWHLSKDLSVSKLREIVDAYNKEKQKNNGIPPYGGNIPDFMGDYSYLWND